MVSSFSCFCSFPVFPNALMFTCVRVRYYNKIGQQTMNLIEYPPETPILFYVSILLKLREEESIELLEEIGQHYTLIYLSLLNVALHVCMSFLELLTRWSSKLLLIIFLQIYIRPYKASVFWMLFLSSYTLLIQMIELGIAQKGT